MRTIKINWVRLPLNAIYLMAFALALYTLFYIPEPEHKFMRAAEKEFNESGTTSIPIADITDFDWDYVCYIGHGWIPPVSTGALSQRSSIERWLGRDAGPFMGNIPNTYSPAFKGAYLFIHGDHVVKGFSYGTWGLRLEKGAIRPLTSRFFIAGTQYNFLTEHNIESEACIDRTRAAFKAVAIRDGENQVLFSSNSFEREE